MKGLQRVMATRGYDGASIQVIAKEAGLTPGLVHYHFRNKQEILLSLLDSLREQVLQRYRRRIEATAATAAATAVETIVDANVATSLYWQRLDAFIDAHLALGDDADRDAVSCWVVIGAEALRQTEVREAYAQAVANDLALLQELVGDVLHGEWRPRDDARAIAAALMSAIQGAYQLSLVAQATPVGFAAPAVRAMARGLIRGMAHGDTRAPA